MASYEWETIDTGIRSIIIEHQQSFPVKLSSLARALGIAVKAATLPAGISGEIRPDPDRAGKFIIRINRHDAPNRQRFTVAHEIGHYLLHKDQIGDGITDDVLYRSSLSNSREAEANRIAADILMPDNLIASAVKTAGIIKAEDTINYLANQFEVSEAAMKIRLGIG